MIKKECYFFYDETNHSRKLTSSTLNDGNFKIDFISVIVGIPVQNFNDFESDYLIFEDKWKKYYGCEELKSTVVKYNKYKIGATSFKAKDIEFYIELFNIIKKHNLYLHFGIFNKIEYLINQMLNQSNLLPFINFKGMSYSMTKALCVYKPHSVIDSIENNINDFLPKYTEFLKKRLKLNTRIHGESENNAFSQHLKILDSLNNDILLDWDYVFSFDGFNRYINEFGLENKMLFIDKEGTGKTIDAAKNWGINNAQQIDSKDSCGVRCADLLAGFIGNFIHSIYITTMYEENDATRDESLLGKEWFCNVNAKTFELYKIAHYVFCEHNNSWYKYFSSCYSDGLISFLALLKHFNEYITLSDYNKNDYDYHQHRVNSILYYDLERHFKDIDGAYGIDGIEPTNEDFYYNQKGAKCYKDYTKHKFLPLPVGEESVKYFVLSAGFFGDKGNPMKQACITISEEGKPICYLLPGFFNEFVIECQERSLRGKNAFPCFMILSLKNGRYSLKLTID